MNKIHKNKPKDLGKNPYATNRGGYIAAPIDPAVGDPKSTGLVGDDLRAGKAGKKAHRGE